MGSAPKIFSPQTLGAFEAASASIPIRPLDRAFERAHIRLGNDPGGPDGARRAQFRRYVAGVDQRDAKQRDRLGDALGALIDEVATSKQDFLIKAAERDGFAFTDGVFRPADTSTSSFAVTRIDELTSIADRGRRLHVLANDDPAGAIDRAKELVESVCRSVLRDLGRPAPAKTADLVDIAKVTLKALEQEQQSAVVTGFGKWKGRSPRHARLAAGTAVTFSVFIAETYAERGH